MSKTITNELSTFRTSILSIMTKSKNKFIDKKCIELFTAQIIPIYK